MFTNLKNKPPPSLPECDPRQFQLYEYHPDPADTVELHILFAHGNGIPALTYQTFLQDLARRLKAHIVAYDMRAIGRTTAPLWIDIKSWGWKVLIQDHVVLCRYLQEQHAGRWLLAGHSVGSWISLLASETLGIADVWLLDPPLLKNWQIVLWCAGVLVNRRDISPGSGMARRRRTAFPSFQVAYETLKGRSFMAHWPEEALRNYLEGAFVQQEGSIQLRHAPLWEAHIFEQYPPMAFWGFLRLSWKFRKELRALFFVGEKSDTCSPKSGFWVKLFFPKRHWVCISGGNHLFPVEQPTKTADAIVKFHT